MERVDGVVVCDKEGEREVNEMALISSTNGWLSLTIPKGDDVMR